MTSLEFGAELVLVRLGDVAAEVEGAKMWISMERVSRAVLLRKFERMNRTED